MHVLYNHTVIPPLPHIEDHYLHMLHTATTTTYNHHISMQMHNYLFMCTLVNALMLQGKTPPAQVAAGDDHHECKWSISLVDRRKIPPAQVAQCQDHLGHKYRSGT